MIADELDAVTRGHGRGGQAHAGAGGAPQHDPAVERQPTRPVRAQRAQ